MRYLTRLRCLPLAHSPHSSLYFHKFTKPSSRKPCHPATSFFKDPACSFPKVQVPCFDTIAGSLSSRKNSSPLHSSKSTLFAQNTRVGVPRHQLTATANDCLLEVTGIDFRRFGGVDNANTSEILGVRGRGGIRYGRRRGIRRRSRSCRRSERRERC